MTDAPTLKIYTKYNNDGSYEWVARVNEGPEIDLSRAYAEYYVQLNNLFNALFEEEKKTMMCQREQ